MGKYERSKYRHLTILERVANIATYVVRKCDIRFVMTKL